MKAWYEAQLILALVCSTFLNVVALSGYDRRIEVQEIVATGKRNDDAIVAKAALHKMQFYSEMKELELLKIQRNEKIGTVLGISVAAVVAVVAGYCVYKWIKNKKTQQNKGGL